MTNPHASGTSVRSSGGKLVTFEDESSRRPTTTITTTVQSKPKHDSHRPTMNYVSDDDKTHTEDESDYTQSVKPSVVSEIQPSPRRKSPASGISALVPGNAKPTIVNNTNKTVATIVRPVSTFKKYESER